MKPIILTLTGLILAAGPTCAQQASAPAGNVENGKTLYLQVGCYQCHGQAGQGARMTGPRISRTEFPFESFLYQLRHGADPGRATLWFLVGLAILIGLLVAVCRATGERPRWRWGE